MRELRATNIRLVWDAIRPGLERALKKGGGDWRPEDVYASCVAGDAFLYRAESGAFCILQMQHNEHLVQKECWVWVAYVPPNETLSDYFPQVETLAREAGAVRMRFESRRPGWHRAPGWEVASSTFTKEL